jgi:ubiquinone/menaquinone biosynthesis C-methylase UbiE
VIGIDGWARYNIWEHSRTVRDLYRQRCLREVEEMTAHAQAAELLGRHIVPGDTLLDVGCGAGYFYHSLKERMMDVEYWGIDASPSLIDIGHETLSRFGLSKVRLQNVRIEDADGNFDHLVCINVLSNIDNYHRPLERMLTMARKTVLLRESLKKGSQYQYVEDRFLDDGSRLNVHVNHYDAEEMKKFIASYGFTVDEIVDRRTNGQPELVIGYPHYWTFLLATRSGAKGQ